MSTTKQQMGRQMLDVISRAKRTDALDQRVLTLAKLGLSARKVASQLSSEGMPISHTSVLAIVNEHKAKAKDALDAPGFDVEAGLPPLPEGASVAARLIYQELAEVRHVARDFYDRVDEGDAPLNAWTNAKQHVLRLIKQLEEMVPAPPADPSKDPMAIACREMTHVHILQAIRVAQAQLGHLCPACQNNVVDRG